MSKNAIILGATSGIGRELARLLINDGYQVLITGRRLDKLEEIQITNPKKYAIRQQDITDIEDCGKFFDEIPSFFNKIDLIVVNSGVGGANYKLTWKEDLPIIKTNVLGNTRMFQLAYNYFKVQGYGQLVGITSVASIRGNRHVPAYFASKAFQASYLESLWMKAKRSKKDITITNILPGFVETKMATGNTFWKAPLDKATKQIFNAIKRKKKKAYITKRWRFVALLLKIAPANWVNKYF
ncbi:MAG: SDR family NAD(P)-dependent oxidoreductase [Flavobacteriaceae bacterium]|nr:SDR family NAD(P)-dependent oxidoreductase [Flavobacteriaceae bacterium]